jgi:uracil-DNA glycosylase family 4
VSSKAVDQDRRQALSELRAIAGALHGIDVECYRRHGRDPLEPVLGLGERDSRWCFFGRDPGEQEVRQQRPFVGHAGQKIRAVMREVGVPDQDIFWMNTVPYKPVGNKPWPVSVRRRCQPALLKLLAQWQGERVIVFGEAAFSWFGLACPDVRAQLAHFWAREDKYVAEFKFALDLGGTRRTLTVCPVPHPSGANARWAKAFPELLRGRLVSKQEDPARCP